MQRKEHRVEIAVRLFVDDLEEALGRASGGGFGSTSRRTSTGSRSPISRIGLTVTDRAGKALDLRWVGMEPRVDEVWVYVEATSTEGLDGATIADLVFFELFDDQVNTVNLKDGHRRTTLVFKPGDAPRTVAFPA